MKARYIIVFMLIIVYAVTIAVMLVVVAPNEVKPKHTHTATSIETDTPALEVTPTATEELPLSPTPTPATTPTPTPTAVYASDCEHDEHEIQSALDSYYDDHISWPTADGRSGDIIWSELVPEYLSGMPLIDNSCDWQVSGFLEGQVCVAHTC